jgi:hypothetical protein
MQQEKLIQQLTCVTMLHNNYKTTNLITGLSLVGFGAGDDKKGFNFICAVWMFTKIC